MAAAVIADEGSAVRIERAIALRAIAIPSRCPGLEAVGLDRHRTIDGPINRARTIDGAGLVIVGLRIDIDPLAIIARRRRRSDRAADERACGQADGARYPCIVVIAMAVP